MKTIKLSRKVYDGESCIFINCEPDILFDQKIRSYPGRIWSHSNRSWYIKDKEGSFRELTRYFREHFHIDTSALHSSGSTSQNAQSVHRTKSGQFGPVEMRVGYSGGRVTIKFLGRYNSSWIEEMKQYGRPYYDKDKSEWVLYASKVIIDSLTDYFNHAGVELIIKKSKPKTEISEARAKVGNEVRSRSLTKESIEALRILRSHLLEKRFSDHTISNYSTQLEFFLKYYHTSKPADITTEDISGFMEDYVIRLGFSSSFQNQMITAIKTYYSLAGISTIDLDNLKRPKMGRPLPQVFSKEEVSKILSAPRNIKHKLILWMIYSSGLRRNEVINIKLNDINIERRILHIRSGKGNIDRVVPLPESVIAKINDYRASYYPEVYLFEGQKGGRYAASSVYSVFKSAMKRAGINKEVGVHSLRHSYATHLHESGLDIRYIQELLGHRSSKTTEIYTHVSRRNLMDIRSPIDDLDLH